MKGDSMTLSEWYNQAVTENEEKYNNKTNNFQFSVLNDEFINKDKEKQILMQLRENEVWLIQNNNCFIDDLKQGKLRIVIGFHPLRLHLGHLALIKEISFYAAYNAEFIFIVANHEYNNVSFRIIDDFWNLLNNYCDLSNCSKQIYWDDSYLDLIKLTDQISTKFTINKILQLFGWDNTIDAHHIRSVLVSTASFLISNRLQPKTTIVLLDINQMPFYELCKIASKKCNLEFPSFAFIRLFPSIQDINKRMSIKDLKSTIFLDENNDKTEELLRRAFTGGFMISSSEMSTNPVKCSFFRIMELLLERSQLENIIDNCLQKYASCFQCKDLNIAEILRRLQKIKKGIYE